MRKFTTRVSMPCTSEQFEADLRGPLEAMGYKAWASDKYSWSEEHCFLLTDESDSTYFFDNRHPGSRNPITIDRYNPTLFLALAAMSEGDEFFAGEMITAVNPWPFGIRDRLVRVRNVKLDNIKYWDYSVEDYFNGPPAMFRKATKEEIIAHLDAPVVVADEDDNIVGTMSVEADTPIKKGDHITATKSSIHGSIKAGDVWVALGQDSHYPDQPDYWRIADGNTVDSWHLSNFRKSTPEEIKSFKGLPKNFVDESRFNSYDDNIVGTMSFGSEPSNVYHPQHYGGDTPYEVIKVLEAWGFDKNSYRFNAIKYLARGDHKGNLKQDLEKAIWYINREIAKL